MNTIKRIKRFDFVNVIICLSIIFFLVLKPGSPLAIAESSNKTTVKSTVNNEVTTKKTINNEATTDNETSVQKVNPVSLTSVNQYTVKEGDSLYLISQKYQISVQSLMNTNGLKSAVIYPGQTLTIPAGNTSVKAPPKANNPPATTSKPGNPWLIRVAKYNHILNVYYQGQMYRSYHVELGDNGLGDKMVSGDHKTPEGTFYVSEKSVLTPEDQYLGTRWMRLSYPNISDAQRGLQDGLINRETYNEIVTAINQGRTPPQNTALGGGVGIHGGDKPAFNHDWTYGCVGLTNKDVETFFDKIPVGTPVIIQK